MRSVVCYGRPSGRTANWQEGGDSHEVVCTPAPFARGAPRSRERPRRRSPERARRSCYGGDGREGHARQQQCRRRDAEPVLRRAEPPVERDDDRDQPRESGHRRGWRQRLPDGHGDGRRLARLLRLVRRRRDLVQHDGSGLPDGHVAGRSRLAAQGPRRVGRSGRALRRRRQPLRRRHRVQPQLRPARPAGRQPRLRGEVRLHAGHAGRDEHAELGREPAELHVRGNDGRRPRRGRLRRAGRRPASPARSRTRSGWRSTRTRPSASPCAGNVYVAHTNFHGVAGSSPIVFSRLDRRRRDVLAARR